MTVRCGAVFHRMALTEPGLQADDIRPLFFSLFPGMRAPVYGLLGLAMIACGGGPVVTPVPVPEARETPPVPAPVSVARVSLPARIAGGSWRVVSQVSVELLDSAALASGSRGDTRTTRRQDVESRGLVSWSGTRSPSGAMVLTGQVDSFTVRTSFEQQLAPLPTPPALVLLDARVDSGTVRVVTRPLLDNECDRPEAAAAALAADVLVRIPDGVVRGSTWQDSSVTLVCRGSVPMTLVSRSQTTLQSIDEAELRLERRVELEVSGSGGSAFRAFDVQGRGQGSQRIIVDVARGVVRELEGRSELTLSTSERVPQQPPRIQTAVQRGTLRIEWRK